MARDTVAEIKDRLSIQDVVSPYVKLTKAGRSMRGLCPFHKEKTPSFHVSLERGTYHCFGCGEGGDAFSFIEKMEGVDFKGALKHLAEKAGVTIEYSGKENKEAASKKERLRALMARAGEWYAAHLSGTEAEAYAKKRGLTKETVEKWRIGYAPDGWRVLLEALSAEGFSTGELVAAGLVKEAEGKPGTYYDRFRDRLMFPICDVAGRAVAFTGRTLDSSNPDSSLQSAKYLNSPETELYHKSEILFGLDKAKDAIRTRRFTLLVEGQMDALLAHQAGFENAIALSGTALTARHLGLLKRYSDNLMLVLDADPAGLRATARSAELALHEGLRVKAARLPAGSDPADLILENAGEFAKRIKEAQPAAEFFLAVLSERERNPHRLLRSVEEIVLPLIVAVESPMERAHFVESAARALGLSTEAVRESLARVKRAGGKEQPAPRAGPRLPAPPRRSPTELRREQLLAVVHAYPETALAKRVSAEYCRITEASQLPSEAPGERALFQAEESFGENPPEDAADELLRAFEETVIREAYQEAVGTLRRAEQAGDAAALRAAESACAALSGRLARLRA